MKRISFKHVLKLAGMVLMLQGAAMAQTTAPARTATPNGSAALPRPEGVEPDVGIGLKKGDRTGPDGRPQFQVPRVAIDPKLPTLWIVGDSTVRNGSYEDAGNGQWGWGRPIRAYFDETKINIQNRAVGGTTSHNFQTTHWPWIVKEIKPGDFLIAQFGHNDAGTPKGNDDETHQATGRDAADNPLHTFGWHMRKYVTDAKEKGAVWAAICSPIPRNRWSGETINPDGWVTTCKEAADGSGATFINLNAKVIEKYKVLGQQKVTDELFPSGEATHPSWAGAVLNAQMVIEGLKEAKSPLVQYLKPEAPTELTNPWGKAR